jgi:hypothetical protein
MAQFAEINSIGKVIKLVEADNNDIINNGGHQSEQAAEYFKKIIPLSSNDNKWVESSSTGDFRGRSATIGSSYDSINNVFIRPKPYTSWTLNNNFDWQAPVAFPTIEIINNQALEVNWDEDNQKWISIDGIGNFYNWNPNTLNWDIVS